MFRRSYYTQALRLGPGRIENAQAPLNDNFLYPGGSQMIEDTKMSWFMHLNQYTYMYIYITYDSWKLKIQFGLASEWANGTAPGAWAISETKRRSSTSSKLTEKVVRCAWVVSWPPGRFQDRLGIF